MDHSIVMGKGLAQLSEAISHAGQGNPRWKGHMKSSDKTWSTGGGNGNPLQYSGLENFMDCIKEISPGCSLEGVMLKLKLQYFGYLM